MPSAEHLECKRVELQTQYDLLSEKIASLRIEHAIQTDTATLFRLKKQIEQAEGERDNIEQQIGNLENELGRNRHSIEDLFTRYLQAVIERCEERRTIFPKDPQRNLLDFYIEPMGSVSPPPKDAAAMTQGDALWDLIAPSLQKGKPCILLAEFGMGKSWLLEMVQYRLARKALTENHGNQVSWIPLRLSLRGFRQGDVLPEVSKIFLGMVKPHSVLDQLRDQAWIAALGESTVRSSSEILVRCFENGRFLFLFDALDEIAMGTRDETDLVLTEIGKLSTHTQRSPVLLTCRRSFFRDSAQENSLRERGFEVFYLWPWSGDNILEYLRKAHTVGVLKMNPQEVIQRIETTHDLRDISSRAMLSAMLVMQWADLALDKEIDLPSLYERHIEKALLDWQSGKARQLESHMLAQYMEEMAFLMFKLDSLSISPADLDEYFSAKFRELGMTKFSAIAESLVRDIKTNSFLLREKVSYVDSYVFCHASVWEFLVARKLVRALLNHEQGDFQVPNRSVNYRSILKNFVIPILRKKRQLDLISSLLAS